jgi:predicted nucleotidyltransferase component of viral defense system
MTYTTAAAFRTALEARLNDAAKTGGPPVGRARKIVAFTRLLARLRAAQPEGWVLKGGVALEMRIGDRARATRDVDLDFAMTLDAASETLIHAGTIDLGDFFDFEIERVGGADVGAGGGIRFRAQSYVGGRLFETLLIDVGVGDAVPLPGDELEAPDLLGFAEISPPKVPAAPLERHLAEKVHALTRRYGADQPSSRPKDLIDIVLISELAQFDAGRLREEIRAVFEHRATHPVPAALPAPPKDWNRPYAKLANEVGLAPKPSDGHSRASAFLEPVLRDDDSRRRWDPESRVWR